uniref:Uncharacterized protein LOC111114197 n=1 Tax=Crassostrea virginica TaxID=6565 RepID=A0A8B8BZC6_CRAVI|nr:uncharacterized protein LOC111114197 [Crassostrea virginica]
MKKCTWFCLFLVVKLAFGAGEIFEANLQLDNHRFDTDVIRRMEEVDFTDCAVYCSDRVDCMSVQYSLTTKACRLFSTVFLSTIGRDPEIGWRYYQKTGGSCPSRHTFTGIDGLCFLNGGEGTRPEGVNYCTKMGSSLILVKSSNIENFLEKILDRTSKSYTHAKSAYIQGTWNFSHWIDDEGEVLQYTKWHSGMTFIPSKSHSIKIKQYNSGYYWREATSGDLYVRNFFCGKFLL